MIDMIQCLECNNSLGIDPTKLGYGIRIATCDQCNTRHSIKYTTETVNGPVVSTLPDIKNPKLPVTTSWNIRNVNDPKPDFSRSYCYHCGEVVADTTPVYNIYAGSINTPHMKQVATGNVTKLQSGNVVANFVSREGVSNIPTFKKGMLCEACVTELSAEWWTDKDKVSHRMVEPFMDYNDPKSLVTRNSKQWINPPNEDLTDQKTSYLVHKVHGQIIQMEDPVVPAKPKEKIDPKGYAYTMGARGSSSGRALLKRNGTFKDLHLER